MREVRETFGVLFFPPGNSGATWYRIVQPGQKLSEKKLADVCFARRGQDPPKAIIEAIKGSDVLVFLSPADEDMPENFFELRKAGKKIVVDMYDDIFSVSPLSPHYGDLGIFEAEMDDVIGDSGRVYLWQDGVTPYDGPHGEKRIFSIERNLKNMETTKEILRSVDLITVTTPYLANLYGEFAPTAVLPDSVDLQVWKPLRVQYPEPYLRLGWRGGWSHYDDLTVVLPALKRIFGKYDWTKLVMSGWRPKGFTNHFPQPRVEVHPFMGHPAYPWHMMALGINVAFYPWKSIPFNQGKNNLCWIEWSALGVPGVYPGLPPYPDYVTNGETGLLAITEDGWFDCLQRLILNKKLRHSMGRAARAEVEAKWDINKNVHRWLEAYLELFKEESWHTESPDQTGLESSSPVLH